MNPHPKQHVVYLDDKLLVPLTLMYIRGVKQLRLIPQTPVKNFLDVIPQMSQAILAIPGLSALATSPARLIKRALQATGLPAFLSLFSHEIIKHVGTVVFLAPACAVIEGIYREFAPKELSHLFVREVLMTAVLVDYLGIGGLDLQQVFGSMVLSVRAHEHKRVDKILVHLEIDLLTYYVYISRGNKGANHRCQFLSRNEGVWLCM